MNANTRNLLLGLYSEWRRLTDLEGEAIREGSWPEVERQQNQKQLLREQIVRAIQQWNAEQDGSADLVRQSFEREFRPIVTGLIEQETRNQQFLADQRESITSRLSAVRQSSTRLRGIQRAYGADSTSRWQSYS